MLQAPATYETDDLFAGKSKFLQKSGAYHAQVTEAKEDDGFVEIHFEVVGPGGERGKTIDSRVYYQDQEGNIDFANLIGVAINLGLLSLQQYEIAKANRQNVPLDFESAQGKQCIIDVRDSTYTDKKSGEKKPCVRVFADCIKHLDDKAFEKVPLNIDLASLAGCRRAGNPFDGPQVGQPVIQPQQQPVYQQPQYQQPAAVTPNGNGHQTNPTAAASTTPSIDPYADI